METRTAKELLHIRGWLERTEDIVEQARAVIDGGPRAVLADREPFDEAGAARDP